MGILCSELHDHDCQKVRLKNVSNAPKKALDKQYQILLFAMIAVMTEIIVYAFLRVFHLLHETGMTLTRHEFIPVPFCACVFVCIRLP